MCNISTGKITVSTEIEPAGSSGNGHSDVAEEFGFTVGVQQRVRVATSIRNRQMAARGNSPDKAGASTRKNMESNVDEALHAQILMSLTDINNLQVSER